MMITVLSVYFKLFHKTKLNPLSKLKGDFVTGTVSSIVTTQNFRRAHITFVYGK